MNTCSLREQARHSGKRPSFLPKIGGLFRNILFFEKSKKFREKSSIFLSGARNVLQNISGTSLAEQPLLESYSDLSEPVEASLDKV